MKSTGLIFFWYVVLLALAYVFTKRPIHEISDSQFWVITGIVGFFHLTELIMLYRRDSHLFFIKPVVIGAFVLFFLQFGALTNYLMRLNNGAFAIIYNTKLIKDPYWLSYCMAIVLASSVAYWFGYRLTTGRRMYQVYIKKYRRFWDYNISSNRLLYGWAMGVIIKIVINYYNAIGHKYIILMLEGVHIPSFVMRLKVFENLSLLFFIMLLYKFYENKRNGFLRTVVIIAFLFELGFAVTSGSRFTIVVLFLSVFLVDYIYSKRLKVYWIFVISGILYTSMTIINSYKEYIFHDRNQVVNGANTIETMGDAMEWDKNRKSKIKLSKELKEAGRIALIGRFNYVNEMAQMMRYKRVDGIKGSDPNFIRPFFTFPVFSVLPKYYLFGIEDPKYGYWATKKLTGSLRTSTAISPIGFGYLAGGPFLVMLIFIVLGVLMKWAELLINHLDSVVGMILYLSIMSTLVMFDSVVPGSFINLIRYSLLLPIVLWLFLHRSIKGKVVQ